MVSLLLDKNKKIIQRKKRTVILLIIDTISQIHSSGGHKLNMSKALGLLSAVKHINAHIHTHMYTSPSQTYMCTLAHKTLCNLSGFGFSTSAALLN